MWELCSYAPLPPPSFVRQRLRVLGGEGGRVIGSEAARVHRSWREAPLAPLPRTGYEEASLKLNAWLKLRSSACLVIDDWLRHASEGLRLVARRGCYLGSIYALHVKYSGYFPTDEAERSNGNTEEPLPSLEETRRALPFPPEDGRCPFTPCGRRGREHQESGHGRWRNAELGETEKWQRSIALPSSGQLYCWQDTVPDWPSHAG